MARPIPASRPRAPARAGAAVGGAPLCSASPMASAAEAAWAKALALMARQDLALLVLDELCIALRYNYLDTDSVVAALRARRPGLHVVATGRNAPPALVEAADLVTEMGLVKHHFAAGVKAQQGIEF